MSGNGTELLIGVLTVLVTVTGSYLAAKTSLKTTKITVDSEAYERARQSYEAALQVEKDTARTAKETAVRAQRMAERCQRSVESIRRQLVSYQHRTQVLEETLRANNITVPPWAAPHDLSLEDDEIGS